MKIDRMTENQLEAVAQLEQRCFSHPWSFNSLEEELNNETSLFFTATEKMIMYCDSVFQRRRKPWKQLLKNSSGSDDNR